MDYSIKGEIASLVDSFYYLLHLLDNKQIKPKCKFALHTMNYPKKNRFLSVPIAALCLRYNIQRENLVFKILSVVLGRASKIYVYHMYMYGGSTKNLSFFDAFP